MLNKIGSFLESAKRIFYLSKKPTWKEYIQMAKVTGIGILLIALLGSIIIFIFKFLKLGV